jgi:hypothetical protein
LRVLRVRAAFLADADRTDAGRFRAAEFACRRSAAADAALCGIFFIARFVARDRTADGRRLDEPLAARASLAAFFLVASDVVPASGGGRSTPARRAFDKPIAMACFVDAAPCFPSRM